MEYVIRIKSIQHVTHDVKRFTCEKPPRYAFIPGQATEISINKKGWEAEKRPFTFTSLNETPDLEFTIKIYQDHPGVTNMLNTLKPGDELIVGDAWGVIDYKGPGYFIAGGAGITPFIAILRQLHKDNNILGNTLLFSNKSEADIILEDEFNDILGSHVVYTITDIVSNKYHNGFIDEQFLREHIYDYSKHFYLCGPPKMVKSLEDCLIKLGGSPDAIVFEK